MARLKIFFRTEVMTLGDGEERQAFSVSQLMPRGAMLVALEGGGQTSAKQGNPADGEIELIPGDFVEFSADKLALLASAPGYPQLVRMKEGKGERIIVDVEPLFKISDDGWTAKMNLYPPLEGGDLPSLDELLEMLKNSGVRWGIREKNIAAAIAAVTIDKYPLKNQVVARGRLPVKGEDAWLRIAIAVGEQAGKEIGDGHMDFRERHLFIPVDKGQLLATKVPATAGLAGINVFGHELPQKPGKDLVLKTGDDIVFNAETGEIHAAIGGVLSVITDTCVKVTAKLVISGDIDFHTGNVASRDAVEISGSVKPGFKVTAGGDVVVGGSVESARVISQGNVVIRGGVMGDEAAIEAAGDVDVAVIDNGSIISKGSVRVARESYYAEIRCLRDIIYASKAKVVSSDLFAGGSITVNDVDTDTSPNSLLAAATMPERYARHFALLRTYHQAQAAVDAWHRRFGSDVVNEDLDELTEDLEDAKASLMAYNLVPGVNEHDRSGGLRYACRQRITINGIIQSGAVIRIGNIEATLKKVYVEGHFALNGDTGKLEFHSGSNSRLAMPVEQV